MAVRADPGPDRVRPLRRGLYLLGTNAPDIADWATPFADTWGEASTDGLPQPGRTGDLRRRAGPVRGDLHRGDPDLGEPFYEKLSEKVEETYGDVPTGHGLPLWKSILRSIKDSLITLGYVLLFTIPLFFLGFVPVIGQTVVPVLGALVSGFFLTVELTTLAMERRGMARKSRFALLRANKAPALGFGVLSSCSSSSRWSRWSRCPPPWRARPSWSATRLAPCRGPPPPGLSPPEHLGWSPSEEPAGALRPVDSPGFSTECGSGGRTAPGIRRSFPGHDNRQPAPIRPTACGLPRNRACCSAPRRTSSVPCPIYSASIPPRA